MLLPELWLSDVVRIQVMLHPWKQLGCLARGALESAWSTLGKSGNLTDDVIEWEEDVLKKREGSL